MHWMLANQGTLHGQEGTGAHMQAYGFLQDALFPDPVQHSLRKMQTGRRSRYRAPEFCIQGLIPFGIDLL